MSDKKRYPLAEARSVGEFLVEKLLPYVDRIELAGSIRRRRPTVGDVEILFIPKFAPVTVDLFGGTAPVSLADRAIDTMVDLGILQRRPNVLGNVSWGKLNKLAVHTATGIPVDLFATTPDAWFNYLVCRTGGEKSNIRVASYARRRGYQWNPYESGFTKLTTGKVFPMESEAAVFEFVNLQCVPPWERD